MKAKFIAAILLFIVVLLCPTAGPRYVTYAGQGLQTSAWTDVPPARVYDVLPVGSEWMIRMAADSEWEMAPTKAAAVTRARELARRYGDWSVRVLSESGGVEAEYTSAAGRT